MWVGDRRTKFQVGTLSGPVWTSWVQSGGSVMCQLPWLAAPLPDHTGRGGVVPLSSGQSCSINSWLETEALKPHSRPTKSESGFLSRSSGDSHAHKYWRGFSPRKGAVGEWLHYSSGRTTRRSLKHQWDGLQLLCLVFRKNEGLVFALNITNFNTHLKKHL